MLTGFLSFPRLLRILTAAGLAAATLVAVAPAASAVPGNDNRSNATLVGPPGTITGTTVGATVEQGEATPTCGGALVSSIWYRTEVTENGTLNVDTYGSNFDTVLAVYRGDSVSSVECNDDVLGAGFDEPGHDQSAVSFAVTPGTYYFQVKSWGASQPGYVSLQVDFGETPQDERYIDTGSFNIVQQTVPNDGSLFADRYCVPSSNPSLWYRMIPSANGTLNIDTAGSDYNTVITVLSGITPFADIACNDDVAPDNFQSAVTVPVTAGVRYYVVVTGSAGETGNLRMNVSGPPPGLPLESALLPPAGPSAPTGVSATTQPSAATVSWTAPADDGGSPISGYVVTTWLVKPGEDPFETAQTFDSVATTQLVDGLANGKSYTFTVKALNDVGVGGESPHSGSVTTPAIKPGAPTGVSAIASDGSATVSWTAPTDDGGSPLTEFKVYAIPCGTVLDGSGIITTVCNPTTTPRSQPTNAGADASSANVGSLDNSTAYQFVVTASNNVGEGAESSPSPEVIRATIPGAPTDVSAIPHDGSATVTWVAPTDTGGMPISGYVVTPYQAGVAQTPLAFDSDDTRQSVDGLTNGASYTFTVHATNQVGRGAVSIPSTAVTPKIVRADSTTTLRVTKTASRIKTSGTVSPKHAGLKVTVTLSKKRNGTFVKLATHRPLISGSRAYLTTFSRPGSGTCKVLAKFAGDADHLPSQASSKFAC